jgi:hypothetical protein
MPWVGFEPTVPASERAKRKHATARLPWPARSNLLSTNSVHVNFVGHSLKFTHRHHVIFSPRVIIRTEYIAIYFKCTISSVSFPIIRLNAKYIILCNARVVSIYTQNNSLINFSCFLRESLTVHHFRILYQMALVSLLSPSCYYS